jgi:hypothetical protein
MEKHGLHLPAEMLEVYKIQIIEKMKQGYEFADVPCELLVALIERTQAWMRLESDEAKFQQEKDLNGQTDVGRHVH